MLSKSKIKWIKSLELKKNRDEEHLFVAEGIKIVSDLIPHLKCRFLAVSNPEFQQSLAHYADEIELISNDEYKKITFQKSPQGVLAVFEKPEYSYHPDDIVNNLSLVLDDVQDPGNFGTIIRLADWFGIRDVFCSVHSADVYSPKTIQATMGAIARVRVHYTSLTAFLENIKGKLPVYGTFMNGNNIYNDTLSQNGIIIMGNEGNGISAGVENYVTRKITIPAYQDTFKTSESLNVGIATAITVAEFRRRMFIQ